LTFLSQSVSGLQLSFNSLGQKLSSHLEQGGMILLIYRGT